MAASGMRDPRISLRHSLSLRRKLAKTKKTRKRIRTMTTAKTKKAKETRTPLGIRNLSP